MPIKTKKYIAFFVLFFIISGFAIGAMPEPAKAQWITSDIPSLVGNIWKAITRVYDNMSKQIAATAFKKSLGTFLNKLAYDSAVYVAAGGSGQKSLVNPFKKEYFQELGDAVAGQFIDELAQKTGFTDALGTKSLCEPVDLTTKVNLLMSFKKPKEPEVPKCSLTAMKRNAQKVAQDNLLELNANITIDEGDVSLTSSSLTADQALAGTSAQTELKNFSDWLKEIVNEYQGIVTVINSNPDKFTTTESYGGQLIELEGEFETLMNSVVEISNQASACYDKYLVNISVGCGLINECSLFGALACDKAAMKANQFAGQLITLIGRYYSSIKELNKMIKEGAFSSEANPDISDIANLFNPEANTLGQFTEIQSALSEKQQKELEAAKLKQLAQGPCKGLEAPISGQVKTPASAVCDTLNQALGKSTKSIETYTGHVVADAFGIFVNTLTAKLMERYFKKGLSLIVGADGVRKCEGGKDICGDKTEDVLRSGASLGGKAAAETSFGGLLTASMESGGQQDILSILASCPPEQPALNNCIIDEPFRRAIEKQYTVKEALEAYKKSGGSEGLDPKKPFGYILVGGAMDEPDFKNGYPYRSMLYLRKYRIIPVGWELAAQYIKDIEAAKQVHTLENVTGGFNDPTSPFFGLVDPAWVLKSPQVFCARQGPGPELISTEIQCEKFNTIGGTAQCVNDDYQARKVSRKEWCADEQTCLEEGENGDCKRYGYCTLEKPSWKLGGTQCDKPYASCEGYTNSITKANYTLLENTLNKSACSQSNVGCQWYCQDAPKMCIGGTRGGQPCSTNNDCASIYCSVGTCSNDNTITCSYDTDCGTGNTCSAGTRRCVNGDTPGVACTTNAQCGRGVVDGVCEEGGVWSCKAENLIADWDMESAGVSDWDDGSLEGCYNAAYSKSTSVVHSGQRSLLLGVSPVDYNGDGSFNNLDFCQGGGQSVTLEVGKTYTLEAWVKSDGGYTNGVIFNPPPPLTNVLDFYYINASSDWQHISRTFTATNTSMAFGFRIPNASTTAVYVDDVRLYEGDRVNLDRDVKKCEAKDAGCNQFIKILPGTNLIGNSGFEDDSDVSATITTAMGSGYINRWYLKNSSTGSVDLGAEIKHTIVHSGKNSLYIEMDSAPNDFTQGLWLGDNTTAYSVVPAGFAFNPEKSYTASAWAYIEDATTGGQVSLTAGPPFVSPAATTQTTPQWERISLTIPAGTPFNQIRIYPSGGPNPTRFYIDDLQLEEGDTSSNYVQYGSSNQVYLNGRRLSCLAQEVGCNLYTPTDGGDPIPAVTKDKDQCPAECAGYAPFQELPTYFDPEPVGGDIVNLIPKTASSCPASAEGCEEFTNLDTVAAGGEAKEYYTYIRQCAKPGTTAEATFYTWEGSEEAGFQLRAWRLKADNLTVPPRPATTDGASGCADAASPDCRTFYAQDGTTYLEELSSTIFISNDCHPLRRTLEGSSADCLGDVGLGIAGSGGYDWQDTGTVGDNLGICFYNAIPSQGLKCQAQYAGCREYRGAAANNLRVLLNDDFEDLTSQGWVPSSLSSESLTVGGRSYNLSSVISAAGAGKSVADLVAQNKVYTLEFWAKAQNAGAALNARFFSGSASILLFETSAISIAAEWNKYSLGPIVFGRAPEADETLQFFSPNAGDGFYLDNIVLREITDNPYLIKDSWETPVSCMIDPEISKTISTIPTTLSADITAAEVGSLILGDSNGFTDPNNLGTAMLTIDGEIIEYQDINGNIVNTLVTRGAKGTSPAAHTANARVWPIDEGAQLGCKEYTDRLNQKTYLRSFSYLCGEDKVGCTEMFNTYNFRSMYDETIKSEYIQRDAVEYVVDNPKVYCDASFKGCEKLGQPALGQNGQVSSWGETYLINDPDQYDAIACESSENMCSEFTTRSGGTIYFKDPNDALCEYRSNVNIGGEITSGWFKKGVIPASTSGLYSLPGGGYAHPECVNSSGAWDETKWTYSCPNEQVGCTEYQAPAVSTLQTGNQHVWADPSTGCLVDNATTTGNCTTPGAMWQYRFDVLESGQYNLTLSTQNYSSTNDPFTVAGIRHNLTILVDGVNKASLDSASSPLAPQASSSAQFTTVNLGAIERGKRIISINWTNDWAVGPDDSNLQINSLILSKSAGNNYYNLEQGVDMASCSGVIDPEKGCVAFYDSTNPILNIKSSALKGNAFAPAACQKCSLDVATCSTLVTCDPAAQNCCCTNNAAVTNPCDSNTILKVKADRQCAEWLACVESEKTTDSKGNIIEMCKKRKACRTAGEGVECDPSDATVEVKQNQTFDSSTAIIEAPSHAGAIADVNLRSGHFKAGVHWARVCDDFPTNNPKACQVDSECAGIGSGVCGNWQVSRCTGNENTLCSADADCQPPARPTNEGVCRPVFEGYYPYAMMEQTGIAPIAFEDDFEAYQSGELLPQCAVNAAQPGTCKSDDGQCVAGFCTNNAARACAVNSDCQDTCTIATAGICLNYWQLPAPPNSPKATNKEFKFGGQSLLVLDTNVWANRISSKGIAVNNGAQYVFTVWLNTKDLQGTNSGFPLNFPLNRLVAQVDSAGAAIATAVQEESNGWTRYVIPFTATSGTVNISIYVENVNAGNLIKAGSKAYVDMISLAPVLEIQNPVDRKSLSENYSTVYDPGPPALSTSAAYTDRSCRIFAKPDALSCKYRERNTGREIQGWRGFCAEADPKNPEYCLQWWPIDLISGEDISKF